VRFRSSKSVRYFHTGFCAWQGSRQTLSGSLFQFFR
jgi:hypothetical protein